MSGVPRMSSWATPDRRVLVSLSDAVLTVFEQHVQDDCGFESGGILIGSVHGPNIAVCEATTPTQWDKRFRFLFERMPFDHSFIARARWRASDGKARYLGEWHTHPQDLPAPSRMDRVEWNALSRKRADGRPMLAIIVGRRCFYMELVPREGVGSILRQVE